MFFSFMIFMNSKMSKATQRDLTSITQLMEKKYWIGLPFLLKVKYN